MRRIDFLDQAAARGASYDELGVNQNFGLAYFAALRNGNDRIDFSGAIHESDTEAILADCRRFGVTEFTVSSTWSGVVTRVAAFVDGGWRLDGMVKVKGDSIDYRTDERIVVPALLLRYDPEGGDGNG